MESNKNLKALLTPHDLQRSIPKDFDDFRVYMEKVRRLSQHTVNSYLNDLKFWNDSGLFEDLGTFQKKIETSLEHFKNENLSDATIALSTFGTQKLHQT